MRINFGPDGTHRDVAEFLNSVVDDFEWHRAVPLF